MQTTVGAPTARIEMLGGLRAVVGGRAIERFQTLKTGALLAFLALHPERPHRREMLANLLWPEADPTSTRNRLNQAVSSLRRQLHPPDRAVGPLLLSDHHCLAVNAQAVTTDVVEFTAALRAANESKDRGHRIQTRDARWRSTAETFSMATAKSGRRPSS